MPNDGDRRQCPQCRNNTLVYRERAQRPGARVGWEEPGIPEPTYEPAWRCETRECDYYEPASKGTMSNDDDSQTPQPPEPAASAPQEYIHHDHMDSDFKSETPTDESTPVPDPNPVVVNKRDTSEDV